MTPAALMDSAKLTLNQAKLVAALMQAQEPVGTGALICIVWPERIVATDGTMRSLVHRTRIALAKAAGIAPARTILGGSWCGYSLSPEIHGALAVWTARGGFRAQE